MIFIFTVFFLVSIFLFNRVDAVYSINEGNISGTGYGNNGERYGSFRICSGSDTLHYFKGSNIYFHTSSNDDSAGGKISEVSLGSWVIDFLTEHPQGLVRVGGQIVQSSLNQDTYRLLGKETFDDVCNNIENIITLTGECGENTKISFFESNNEKVGSIAPPYGYKVYYLFGSEVNCD